MTKQNLEKGIEISDKIDECLRMIDALSLRNNSVEIVTKTESLYIDESLRDTLIEYFQKKVNVLEKQLEVL